MRRGRGLVHGPRPHERRRRAGDTDTGPGEGCECFAAAGYTGAAEATAADVAMCSPYPSTQLTARAILFAFFFLHARQQ